jgi:LysR family transcriptional regulator, glycine cleavage system transcriptional activator
MSVMTRPPPLHLLRVFECAARHLSFKRAAEELSVTPSAISHQIKALEEHLKIALFERGARSLSLTAAGAHYAGTLHELFDRLKRSTAELHAEFGRSRLKLHVTPFFLGEMLIPRLEDFRVRHPDVEIQIDTALSRLDEHPSSADLSIVLGEAPWSGLVADPLVRLKLVPVCAPELQIKVKADHPSDWAAQTIIRYSSRLDAWEIWAERAGIGAISSAPGLSFDSIYAALRAAEQGLGIAMAPLPLAAGWLASGRLMRASPIEVDTALGFHLVHREKDVQRPAVRAFRAWAKATLAS